MLVLNAICMADLGVELREERLLTRISQAP
jgi:hypothetical protein